MIEQALAAFKTWFHVITFSRSPHLSQMTENAEQAGNFLSPTKFLATMVALHLLILAFGSSWTATTWSKLYPFLTQAEKSEFMSAFQIKVRRQDRVDELFSPGSTQVSRTISNAAGGLEVDEVAEYLKKQGHDDLAFKLLKGARKFDWRVAVVSNIGELLIPVFFFMTAFVAHSMYKSAIASRKFGETKAVLYYCMSSILPVATLLEVISWKIGWISNSQVWAGLGLVLFAGLLLGNALKATHRTGTSRLVGSFIVLGTFYMFLTLVAGFILSWAIRSLWPEMMLA